MKSKIKTVVHTGSSQWKDKTLEKYLVVFENEENGTLTTGFNANDKAPEIGDELEYNIEDKGFGNEIKPVKAGGGFKGGGSRQWTPEQVAQQDAIKLTCAYLEQRSDVSSWKQFFIEAKAFMVEQIKIGTPVVEDIQEGSKPAETTPENLPTEKLPF